MEQNIEKLQEISKRVRRSIVEMVHTASSGHPGGSLSCTDILVCLYHNEMNLNLDENGKRIDKFVLSKGHATPAYYSVLSSAGFIPEEDLKCFRKFDGYLEGHPTNKIPGVDTSSGSLGQGLSIANGMALSKKISNQDGIVYCLVGDGELEEGQNWEAMMTSNKYKLNNLVLIVDNNGLQIDGNIENVKSLDNLVNKIESFGFFVQTVDGHDHLEIIEAINNAKKSDKPNCIIAKTIKGKGISYMENQVAWHGKAINDSEYEIAIKELV
jgi:transketolase